jgi:hypothetical protein
MALQAAAQEAQADTIGEDGPFTDQPDVKTPEEGSLGAETLARLKGMQSDEEGADPREGEAPNGR